MKRKATRKKQLPFKAKGGFGGAKIGEKEYPSTGAGSSPDKGSEKIAV